MIEFLAVTILTVVCLLALAQMAVWVWARDVAVSAVHEGARTAAETGRPLDDGVARDALAAARRAGIERRGLRGRSRPGGRHGRGAGPRIGAGDRPVPAPVRRRRPGHRVRRRRGAAMSDA